MAQQKPLSKKEHKVAEAVEEALRDLDQAARARILEFFAARLRDRASD